MATSLEIYSEDSSTEQTIQHLLDGEVTDQRYDSHPLFCEMDELVCDDDGVSMWKETARWIKFEENVEDVGNRWSKPHVASLSLHSLFQLRNLILNGNVILDIQATSIEQIADLLLTNLITNKVLKIEEKDKVKEVLLKEHIHQHQREPVWPIKTPLCGMSTSKESRELSKNASYTAVNQNQDSIERRDTKYVQHNFPFMRKIPERAEASSILVGEVDFLEQSLSVFIRLHSGVILDGLAEVPVPTRFIYILMTSPSSTLEYHEIGRAMGTLMSDEVFREIAYKARNKNDLLAGINEFLNAVVVLPPGEWDPTIRIEPPATVPSQDHRRRLFEKSLEEIDIEEEERKRREESGLARTGVLFGGLMNDLKRKAPWYWSDFKDALAMQSIASWFFLYFACLSPIITFGGLLSQATGNNMAAMESLISGFVCGMGFGLFSGQPLNILGSTGPVLVFETIVYDFCNTMEWDFMPFRLWIGIWVAVILMILVAIDASAFVCYITRFTEENFAALVALIYIYEAFGNVWAIGEKYATSLSQQSNVSTNCSCLFDDTTQQTYSKLTNTTAANETLCSNFQGTVNNCFSAKPSLDIFLMSILLCLGTFLISVNLKSFRSALFFPSKIRQFMSDFAVIIAVLLMTLLDYNMGVATPKLEVPHELKPTLPNRGWIISPFNGNPLYSIFLAIPPALLGTILIFMDQQITSVIVNRREHKLRKGCGYHLDLFVLSGLILVCSIMGLPWFVAATVLSINHVNSLKLESDCAAPGDKPQFLGVREQRVTHILIFLTIGLSVFLTPILGYIPMPVLFGVFLYMGISSLQGLQLIDRVLIMFMPNKYQPEHLFLRQVSLGRIHLFTIIQIACLACLWLVKSFSQTSILFPLMLVVMIGIRKLLDYCFTKRELKILDDSMPEINRKNYVEDKNMGCCAKICKFFLGPKLLRNEESTKSCYISKNP